MSEQTATLDLYIFNWLVFITVLEVFTARYGLIAYIKQIYNLVESVYSAVRTDSY
jgi:hypothetical protein